jgi:phosphoserine phosphatase
LEWVEINTAFFDLDGTITEGSTGVEFARILCSIEGKADKWKEFWENQNLFKNPNISYDEKIEILSRCFAKGVENTDIKLFQQGVKQLRGKIKIRRHFLGFYHWLIKNKFKVFVLTASPVEVFAALPDFKFTNTFGLILEKNDRKYSGRCMLSMTTKAKKTLIRRNNIGSVLSFG